MIDFSDHRVIAITISLLIAIVSLFIILIRYLLGRKKKDTGKPHTSDQD